ncbi:MAG TPA: pyridoxamine 5'-phosphate oxidase family protein [Stellaceae bacterium]|jgi:general stress protein 26|nr:pyridoxamine 5'-phosphate oxidase family protein [Stellaceae bacterium]
MSNAPAEQPSQVTRVNQLLAAASRAMAEVPFCWVITPAADGVGAHARAVKDQKGDTETNPWTRWFLARRVSRKVAEIRRVGRATLAYQHESGNAYVTISGRADVIDERSAVESRFHPSNEQEASVMPQLLAVRVTADHLELHVRGVTAEPWGQGRTFLDRAADGSWRLAE